MATDADVTAAFKHLRDSGLVPNRDASPDGMIEAWATGLHRVPPETLRDAVDAYLVGGPKYWPSWGQILQIARDIRKDRAPRQITDAPMDLAWRVRWVEGGEVAVCMGDAEFERGTIEAMRAWVERQTPWMTPRATAEGLLGELRREAA